jgi:hypothetical protein
MGAGKSHRLNQATRYRPSTRGSGLGVAFEFIRNIEVLVGVAEEYKGGNNPTRALRIFSDGSRQTLRISCRINKSKISIPNAAEIEIYNLSPETRNNIRRSQAQIVVNAGRAGLLSQVFVGSVISVETVRQGADIVTKIRALTAQSSLLQTAVSGTYGNGKRVAEVVEELALEIPEIVVTTSRIAVDGLIGRKGFTYFGMVKDVLDRLAGTYGFSWSIQDNTFQAQMDKRVFSGNVRLESRSGLMLVSPILQGASDAQTGVNIKALFIPQVEAGNTVDIHSSVSPDLNGRYEVHTMSIHLDTFGDDWFMDIQSFLVL